jgi:hypothetical protein
MVKEKGQIIVQNLLSDLCVFCLIQDTADAGPLENIGKNMGIAKVWGNSIGED